MAPAHGQDFDEVQLRSADSHGEAVNSLCKVFSVEPNDVFAVCRLGITNGEYEDVDTTAIIRKANANHEFVLSPDLTITIDSVAELLSTTVDNLFVVSYETNNGTKTANTVVILETAPDGTQQLRFIDLYDRFESPNLDEKQETLFHLNISRAEYLGDRLFACHHTIMISDVGILDSFENHTEGADHSQLYHNNVSLYGKITPNLATDASSQETVHAFSTKFTQPEA